MILAKPTSGARLYPLDRDAVPIEGAGGRGPYGLGIGYPPSWLEPLDITRTSTDVMSPGTTFVLHACLLDEAESIGVLVGSTYAMTATAYELLSWAGGADLAQG